uniref:Uncharacterized protein n=1 Tax=Arion vulgaris TaxID=1028688 RepID=A0A0B7BKR4_9EUPU
MLHSHFTFFNIHYQPSHLLFTFFNITKLHIFTSHSSTSTNFTSSLHVLQHVCLHQRIPFSRVQSLRVLSGRNSYCEYDYKDDYVAEEYIQLHIQARHHSLNYYTHINLN